MSAVPTGPDGQPIPLPRSAFITGASGFIGRALAEKLRSLGVPVRGMDLVADPAHDVVAGDLTRPESWRERAAGCELFINTAAIVSMNAEWEQYRAVSVHGMRNALQVAEAAGAKRFVHYSSVCALGWDFPDGVDETWPVVIGPDYAYGVSKGASEHLVLATHAAGRMACTVVRPGDVYGPGSRAWLLEPLKLVRAGAMLLPDHGRGRFSPVYIDDLLDGTLRAACLPQGAGQIFILGGGYSVSCAEFFSWHLRWAGRHGAPRGISLANGLRLTAALRWVNKRLGRRDEACPDAMYHLARRGGYSITKARELLGYAPQVDFTEGMRRSEAWLRETGEI